MKDGLEKNLRRNKYVVAFSFKPHSIEPRITSQIIMQILNFLMKKKINNMKYNMNSPIFASKFFIMKISKHLKQLSVPGSIKLPKVSLNEIVSKIVKKQNYETCKDSGTWLSKKK